MDSEFDTEVFKHAFKIWDVTEDGEILFGDLEDDEQATEVYGWAVSDSGLNENQNGIYLGITFDNHHVSVSLTRRQLKQLLATVNARWG